MTVVGVANRISSWAIVALNTATRIPVRFLRKISETSRIKAPMDIAAPERPAAKAAIRHKPTTAGAG
ncbi:hypothetical protein D3C73_1377840 [compost metagenome]